jgi:hypothetical protein
MAYRLPKAVLDLDLILALVDLRPVSNPIRRSGVARGVPRDLPLGIDDAMMAAVDFRDPEGGWFQDIWASGIGIPAF